jgi:pre-rRNA-processing protein TSR4
MASSNLSVPVLLGVSDEPVSSDQTDFTTNKFVELCDPIAPSVLKDYQYFCKCCNQVQILICQLYCPLAASPFHRTLYILACVSKSCWNKSDSWRGLRGQSHAQDTSTKIENATKSDPMFDVDDDWGDAEDDATSLFTTQKSTELAPMVTAPCHDCNDSESESDVASGECHGQANYVEN